jgi:hypothetical protein
VCVCVKKDQKHRCSTTKKKLNLNLKYVN